MAICPCCEQEMLDGVSCDTPIVVAGQVYDPIPWGSEIPPRSELRNLRRWRQFATAPCGDCETPPGGIHHHGCDIEECPACHGQAISCDCHEDPDEGEWDPAASERPGSCRAHGARRQRRKLGRPDPPSRPGMPVRDRRSRPR